MNLALCRIGASYKNKHQQNDDKSYVIQYGSTKSSHVTDNPMSTVQDGYTKKTVVIEALK